MSNNWLQTTSPRSEARSPWHPSGCFHLLHPAPPQRSFFLPWSSYPNLSSQGRKRSCCEHIHTTDYGFLRRASRGNYNLKVACGEGRRCSLQKRESPGWAAPYPGTLLGARQVGRACGPRWPMVSWFLEVLITIFFYFYLINSGEILLFSGIMTMMIKLLLQAL